MAAGCSLDEPVKPLLPGDGAAPAIAQGESQGRRIRRFSDLDDDSLWARITEAGGLVNVGLRQAGRSTGMSRGRIVVSATERLEGRRKIAGIRGIEFVKADTLLPIIQLRLTDRRALTRLRRLPRVEYVEPGAFVSDGTLKGVEWHDVESGCSIGVYSGPSGNSQVTPGDLVPWNYRRMWIDSAWAYTSGRGVTVGLVDTGIDQGVPELNGLFATGYSQGRTFVKDATKLNYGATNPWHDTCGHGTRMASVVAGPRNGTGMLGVAWGADLYGVRVDDDVLLSEVDATRMGIRRAASVARVVTLAFGTPFFYSSISQELDYWYFNTEAIIFAAAGTSPCWQPLKNVTFPGLLNTVITVTGFDESGTMACNAHRGPEVDFAAYTEQPAQGLAILGNQLAGLSGSSGATAVLAGVTALYLSLNPSASRGQVLSALTQAASPNGGRSWVWGFGVPNVMCLMREMCTAWIEGPNLIQRSGRYTWTLRQVSSPGPFSYQWSTGETTQSISRYITVTPGMTEQMLNFSVTVRDLRNGRTRYDSRIVMIRDPYGCPTCF